MHGFAHRPYVPWAVVAILAFCGRPVLGAQAKVRLDDGTQMLGDVALTADEVLIRNIAGVVRCPRERVSEIEWLEPAKTVEGEYMRRVHRLAPDDVGGQYALAAWLVEQEAYDLARRQCAVVLRLHPEHAEARLLLERIAKSASDGAQTQPAADDGSRRAGQGGEGREPEAGAENPEYEGVPPPPPLSEKDILRLKLSEVALEGVPERLSVRFPRLRTERDVEDLVRDEIERAPDFDPDWIRTLQRGQPHEKLPIILKATGLKYADRIEIRGNPRAFTTYRQRVLPLVARGCVRSGCHGGRRAHAFRFPAGAQSSDEFVYTSFALLDQLDTSIGPMIDRVVPEESALVRYLLPAEEGREVHPPVESRRVLPMLRGTRDHRYQMLIEWIGSLRSPHPDYGLEYEFPAWLKRASTEVPAPQKAAELPADATGNPKVRE